MKAEQRSHRDTNLTSEHATNLGGSLMLSLVREISKKQNTDMNDYNKGRGVHTVEAESLTRRKKTPEAHVVTIASKNTPPRESKKRQTQGTMSVMDCIFQRRLSGSAISGAEGD